MPMYKKAEKLSWLIAARQHNNFYDCRAQARLLFQGSRAVRDSKVGNYLNLLLNKDVKLLGLDRGSNLAEFKHVMHKWIQNHKYNQLSGLDQYDIDFSAGTTQSFDSFYYRHRSRRMRCFVGEYFYHLKSWISNHTNWSFVTDLDPLVPGDALVISMPFCDTGSVLPDFDSVLDLCNRNSIPVLVDCCYYSISHNVCADLDRDCVDTVCFSLSKTFPVANLRIGIRYTRKDIFDGQKLHDSINYNNTLSAWVGLNLMQQFRSDYIYDTFQQQQQQVCDYFDLVPSDSVLFASGDQQWSKYNRANLLNAYQLDFDPDKFNNRISLSAVFDHWDLFEFVKNESATNI